MLPAPLLARFRARRFETSWQVVSARLKQRAGPASLAIAIELLILLALLSLGAGAGDDDKPKGATITTFDVSNPEVDKPEPSPSAPQEAAAAQSEVAPADRVPAPIKSASPPPVVLPRAPVAPPVSPPNPSPQPSASAPPRIRAVIRSDMAGNRGPADTGSPGDSQRIAGSGPNGEPLYAAKWYREPSDDEFRGYFSRVSGSGWALINCRTEPEFRVDRCVLVDQSEPAVGSAVLAMAWQFRVRPPRVGGRSMVGEWVRIRIDYIVRRS